MNSYEIKIRFLEKELLAFGITSSDNTSGWINKATIITFLILVFLGTFGKNLLELYQAIFKG